MIEVLYRKGIYLPELDFWLDPHAPQEKAFVSHAHFDHYANHRRFVCSQRTGVIANQRFRVAKSRIEAHEFGEVWHEKGFKIRLLPAGHIYGSAMIHFTRLSDGATLLYTGDFKTGESLTAETAELLPSDQLITETTFGLPKYVFPPVTEVHQSIIAFVRATIADGEVPVILGYSLGKAQEVVALLEKNGIACLQHKAVAAMTEACRTAGLDLKEALVFEGEVPSGVALICPPNTIRSKALRRLKNRRTIMLTGWALNANARYRYQADEALPLSDHADFPGLLKAVSIVKPKRVLTLHGFTKEFAAELRARGIEAWSIFGNDQLELGISGPSPGSPEKDHFRPECGFREFSDVLHEVEMLVGRIGKKRRLAAYLRRLGPEELKDAATWLSGRIFGRGHRYRNLNVGSSLIRQALLAASKISPGRYRAISAMQNDPARTARIVLSEARLTPESWSLARVSELLSELASSSGSLQRAEVLSEAFRALHPNEGESLVRILSRGMRIGVKEGALEQAVALAFDVDEVWVREGHMLLGDLGHVADLARRGKVGAFFLTPLVPVKVMLASPEESAKDLASRLGLPLWLEEKYDGIRAQLHKAGDDVSIFSRDLRSLNDEFPELIHEARKLEGDFVLDGEIIAFEEGRLLTFFDLQKRLGRKKGQGDLFLGAAIPVRFVAFDVLFAHGKDLTKLPLRRRRETLEELPLSLSFEVVEVREAGSIEEIESAFKAAKVAGNEGLIAKDAASCYMPGRRGKSWLKLKKAMPTLDCVVVKAQQGHGRRAEVLSDYTFSVRDEDSGRLRTIGKAYIGLTDQEIEDLTEVFRESTIDRKRRVHTVEPRVVLEIAFDSINRSKRHDSGLALRFPRIKAIRWDKSVDEIDTLKYAESLLA